MAKKTESAKPAKETLLEKVTFYVDKLDLAAADAYAKDHRLTKGFVLRDAIHRGLAQMKEAKK